MTHAQRYRFPTILVLSMVFGMPALHDLMMEPQRFLVAGFSYLAALALSWFGVSAILSLVEHYAAANAVDETPEAGVGEGLGDGVGVGEVPGAGASAAADLAGEAPRSAEAASSGATDAVEQPGDAAVPADAGHDGRDMMQVAADAVAGMELEPEPVGAAI